MKIFGILNVTPDSFSDNIEGLSTEDIAKKGYEMMREGADYIDIGAESTRPNATPLTAQEEWARLEPVLKIAKNLPTSIDTYRPETAEAALKFPQVEYINDVSGLKNPEMARVISENNAKLILMHSLTVPADKSVIIQGDPIIELSAWIEERFSTLKEYQIPAKNVIIDIGLGFGKTAEQSIELLKNIGVLTKLVHEKGGKTLVGHSRKSFLTHFTSKPANERDFETALITQHLYAQNVDYVRVHDVQSNKQAIDIASEMNHNSPSTPKGGAY